jgi:ethanolamine ammonia-lyase small subunit
LAQLRSAAIRHNPSAAAVAAAGVSSAATTKAIRRCLPRLAAMERLANRILTRMTM